MLLLRLLAERDMYGYQVSEELAQRSNDTFALKAGTLYPIPVSYTHLGPAQTNANKIFRR